MVGEPSVLMGTDPPPLLCFPCHKKIQSGGLSEIVFGGDAREIRVEFCEGAFIHTYDPKYIKLSIKIIQQFSAIKLKGIAPVVRVLVGHHLTCCPSGSLHMVLGVE